MPQPAVSAIKRNSRMDVAITVLIAKRSSALVVEVECHYAQTRYGAEIQSFPSSRAYREYNGMISEITSQINQRAHSLPNGKGNVSCSMALSHTRLASSQ